MWKMEKHTEIPDKGRYKLRVEMGWGKQNLYRWNGRIQVTGGKIIALNPYFRGRSVLAPSQDESYDADSINDIATYTSVIDEDRAEWTCDTVGNKSTLHPSTSSLVFEIQGDLNTIVYFKINHKEYKASIKDLLEYGYVTEMEYYHSQAFKIHPALPCTRYQFEGKLKITFHSFPGMYIIWKCVRKIGNGPMFHRSMSKIMNNCLL